MPPIWYNCCMIKKEEKVFEEKVFEEKVFEEKIGRASCRERV